MVLPKSKPNSALIRPNLPEIKCVKSIYLRPKSTKSIYRPTNDIQSNRKPKSISTIVRKNSDILNNGKQNRNSRVSTPQFNNGSPPEDNSTVTLRENPDVDELFDRVHLKIDFILDRMQKLESTISIMFDHLNNKLTNYNEHEIHLLSHVSKTIQHNRKHINSISETLSKNVSLNSYNDSAKRKDTPKESDAQPARSILNLRSKPVQKGSVVLLSRRNSDTPANSFSPTNNDNQRLKIKTESLMSLHNTDNPNNCRSSGSSSDEFKHFKLTFSDNKIKSADDDDVDELF